MTVSRRLLLLPALMIPLGLPACSHSHADEKEHGHHEQHKIVVTGPLVKDVTVTQQYVCQIRSQRHIEIRALQEGFLEEIHLKEGQAVSEKEVMFKVFPPLYQARLEAERAKSRTAEIKYLNTKRLNEMTPPIVSDVEVMLARAEWDETKAKVKAAETEMEFTVVRAPFDGIIDRFNQQQGSLVKKEEVLTTLSDNRVMWVKFNVPEVRYFEYMAGQPKGAAKKNSRIELADARVELMLANGSTFEHDAGNTVVVEGEFNPETGNIQFRADFPNPNGLLRHGQTGTVLIRRAVPRALVIPQRATFEVLDKRYVYVVGDDHVVHRREIVVGHEMDDIFVVTKGLDVKDRIVLEGVQQVHDGDKVEFESRKPEDALANQKHHAE